MLPKLCKFEQSTQIYMLSTQRSKTDCLPPPHPPPPLAVSAVSKPHTPLIPYILN